MYAVPAKISAGLGNVATGICKIMNEVEILYASPIQITCAPECVNRIMAQVKTEGAFKENCQVDKEENEGSCSLEHYDPMEEGIPEDKS